MTEQTTTELLAIASFENPRMAQALADYLTVKSIPAHVMEKERLFYVVIAQEDKIAQAQQITQEFVANPNQDKFMQASWQRNQVADLGYGKSSEVFWSRLLAAGNVTLGGLALIFAIQLAVYLGWSRELVGALHFPMRLDLLSFSDIYRLWTPALLHGDWAHLVFNAFWWWWLAQRVEREESAWRLVNISLVTALVAHLAQYALVGSNFVGLSGVVYGLFGYVWWRGKTNDAFFIPNALMVLLVGWMILGFADVMWMNMANWAHLGGLVAGLAFAVLRK